MPGTRAIRRSRSAAGAGSSTRSASGRSRRRRAPRRVLLIPFPLPGHLSPFLALASELGRRGHVPVVYAEPEAEDAVVAAGAVFAAAATRAAWRDGQRDRQGRDLVRWAGRLAARTAPHVAERIEEMEPDALVVDEMHLGAVLAAEASGRCWFSLPTTPALRHPSFHDWPSMVPTAGLRRRLGLPSSDRNSLESGRSPRGALLPWTPEFDIGAPGPSDRHVGPLLWDGVSAPAVAGPRPELLVSLSTSPDPRLRAALDAFLVQVIAALAELPYRSLITARAPAVAAPPHLRVVPFAEHAPLMGSLRLFIHHGGWGSVGRCLLAGVPMIVAPFERDQPTNGLLCRHLGLGALVQPASASARELRPIIESLARSDAPQAQAVRAYAARLGKARPAARAADRVLRALGRSGR